MLTPSFFFCVLRGEFEYLTGILTTKRGGKVDSFSVETCKGKLQAPLQQAIKLPTKGNTWDGFSHEKKKINGEI